MKAYHPRAGQTLHQNMYGAGPFTSLLPADLPPEPPVVWGEALQTKLANVMLMLGELRGMAASGLDLNRLTYVFLRKEAVFSSQIEGTQSS